MSKIKKAYMGLCALGVLKALHETKLIKCFFDYVEAEGQAEKLKKYGTFVNDIYENGGSLTVYTRKVLFENENVYVRGISKKEEIKSSIKNSLLTELDTLSYFVTLTPNDFISDMKLDTYAPSYDTESADFRQEYIERAKNIEKYGYGIFASHCMFSVSDNGEIQVIESADTISISKFIGYESERQRVIDNTVAFIEGRPSANILLYGDAGTGKSSSVKAVANHFFDKGIRLIEIRKNQLLLLPKVMGEISKNPLKFIIFIDDLSFNKNDDSFSMLKATLEGSASVKSKNAVIYATSNRRHIVKESFGDREGSDIHRNDTVQETLSLSERFGLTILFAKPEKKLYLEIVHQLAARNGIEITAELDTKAETFALNRGYRSARCAEQFIDSLL